ncbi:MAG: hypothetical protein EOO62_18705, partial [Hymenobacter sp.]
MLLRLVPTAPQETRLQRLQTIHGRELIQDSGNSSHDLNQAAHMMFQGLNIGGGGGATQEIKVRVRKAEDDAAFYPYDFILGTMLHEIAHNVYGPHDAAFYKMLDMLTEVRGSR